MKRRTTTQGGTVALRRASAATLETLELRRMLAGDYQLASTIIDTEAGGAYRNFGGGVATSGNLALVSSPGEFGGYFDEQTQEMVEYNTTEGQVSLVDTSTGDILQTFHNPLGDADFTLFGASVAFVDGKIAISAPNSLKIYIYDDATDGIPDRTYEFGGDPLVIYGGQLVAHGDDLLVSVLQHPATTGNNGAVLRYDLDDPGADPVQTYFNPSLVELNDQFGTRIASNGTNFFVKGYQANTPVVVALNTAGDHLHTYVGLPGDTAFATGLATVGDDVIISSPAENQALRLDLDGNVVATYSRPNDRYQSFAGTWGTSVTVNGDNVLIGDPWSEELHQPDDFEPNFEHVVQVGAADLFDVNTGTLLQTIENPNPDEHLQPDSGDYWDSFSLATAALPDGSFLVAAPFADNVNGINAGTVYVYDFVAEAPTNNAPVAGAITGPSSSVRQQSVTFNSSFSDADLADTHTVTWDFGDNTSTSGAATQGSVNASHVYTVAGTYTVTMTVDDGTDTDSSTFEVTVTGTGEQGGVLYVGGSEGADSVIIAKSGSGTWTVTTAEGTQTYTGGRVVILGGDGNDVINVGSSVTIPVEIRGGAGNDTLKGGAGNDIVLGEAGDDLLAGGQGRDLMIGGSGGDRIAGDVEDDILISGTTVHDNNSTALDTIMTAWMANTSFSARVASLKAGPLTPDNDVFDDGSPDLLTGGSGEDWFLFNVDGAGADTITDLSHKDFADDLDIIMS